MIIYITIVRAKNPIKCSIVLERGMAPPLRIPTYPGRSEKGPVSFFVVPASVLGSPYHHLELDLTVLSKMVIIKFKKITPSQDVIEIDNHCRLGGCDE